MLNLSPLTPEARPIVEAAAAIYLRHLQPRFVGLVVHGSALKGGFFPGCSDIDLLLFLDQQAFASPFEIWRLPKLPATSPVRGVIRAFFQAARTYYPIELSIEEGLQVIATGMAFLQAAHGWRQEYESTCHSQT